MITNEMIRADKNLALSLHREMWTWVANNPNKSKSDWPRWEHNGGDVESCTNTCFCCEYSHNNNYEKDCCENCPISWVNKKNNNFICERMILNKNYYYGIYERYLRYFRQENFKKASQLARAIANLPEAE